MAVLRMARVLLLLAWLTAYLQSYVCTSYGASIIAFGLGYLLLVILWLYVVWRQYHCLWPGLLDPCSRSDIRRMARVLLPLTLVTSSL